MRILLTHRYFWPDTPPYATLLRAIADRWSADGHEVTVLTSQPSYNRLVGPGAQPGREMLGNLWIRRVWLFPESKNNKFVRLLNLGLFMLRIVTFIILRRRHFDVVMAATTPPVMIAWIARIATALRGGSFVYHCQDIHPELLHWAGMIETNLLYRWLRGLDSRTVCRATKVVVLSTDMERTIHDRPGLSGRRMEVMNNFVIPDYGNEAAALRPDEVKSPNKFRVLFAGNIGRFQGLEGVIDCAHRLQEIHDIEFVFVGDGAAKGRLIEASGSLNNQSVHFLPYRPQCEVESLVKTADLCLVTLAANIIRAAYPSKTMTYLKMGCPLLVLVEQGSELGRMTEREGLGYVAFPNDIEMVTKHILDARSSPAKLAQMRLNARAVAKEKFGKEACLRSWSELLQKVQNDRSTL